MSQITEQIKEKIDIVEFLKERLQLNPAGKNYKALCPFHKEANPSFMVSPERQSWYCFGGCNEGGDIFKFLMKYENLEFYEALKVLAEKAGVELKTAVGAFGDYRQYGVLYEINEAAKNFFKSRLDKPVWDYLAGRGLNRNIVEAFELGLASVGFDELAVDLIGLGFNVNDIERAGLIIKNRRGMYQDRFCRRLMFPISNSFGKTVGFTGRLLGESPPGYDLPKYLNSPETPIFSKSRLLYGFNQTKTAIREAGDALLVEGQMDFLMAYQDGVKNVAAVSGTALTGEHLKTLRRLTDKIILCFDNDEAGQLAAERSLDLAAGADFTVRILLLTEKDPADIVQAQPGRLRQLVGQAGSAREFLFRRYLKPGNDSAAQKKAIRVVLGKIGNIASGIDRAAWLRELSAQTGVAENILIEELEKLPGLPLMPTVRFPTADTQPPISVVSRKQLIIQRIIDLGGKPDLPADMLPAGLAANLPSDVILRASLENSLIAPDKKSEELSFLQKELRKELFKEARRTLRQKIIGLERADAGGEALQTALREFDEFNKKFYNTV